MLVILECFLQSSMGYAACMHRGNTSSNFMIHRDQNGVLEHNQTLLCGFSYTYFYPSAKVICARTVNTNYPWIHLFVEFLHFCLHRICL